MVIDAIVDDFNRQRVRVVSWVFIVIAPNRRLVIAVLDICAARIKLRVSSDNRGLSARGGRVA